MRSMIGMVIPIILCAGISLFTMIVSNLDEIYTKTNLFEGYINDFEYQIDRVTSGLLETQKELYNYYEKLEKYITNQQNESNNDSINNNQYLMELEKLEQRLNELEETVSHYPENTQQATDYATLLENINNNINNMKGLISKNISNDSKNSDNTILICILSGLFVVLAYCLQPFAKKLANKCFPDKNIENRISDTED